jgi:hypothetical protein
MSAKRISPLRQRMTKDTPAIIQFLPLLTIECLRSAGSKTQDATFIRISMTESDADAAIILTSSPKRSPVRQG